MLFRSKQEWRTGDACPSLHLDVVQSVRGAKFGSGLVTVAVVIDVARALQTDSVRRKLSALLWLSFRGGGRFGGFVGLELVSATDWVHHMKT